ncbi:MAG: VWA domain-containing protein [Candidatus Hodarchaeota archaeon]
MSNRERRDYWEAMKRYRRAFTQSISQRIQIQDKSYYWEAIKKHRRTVALLIAATITFPLFIFTAIPPLEIEREIERETPIAVQTPITISTPVQVNISAGEPIFLESQPPPSLIDSDIVICVDESGSMQWGDKINITRAAIDRLFELLKLMNQKILSNDEYLVRDRVALTSFHTTVNDYNWLDNAFNHTDLDFINSSEHFENITLEGKSLQAYNGHGTDIWAGLNKSLEILLDENNQRATPALKSIILLTDGLHQSGPWGNETSAAVKNPKYIEWFCKNDSTDNDPNYIYSRSPVKIARENGVKIYCVGIRGSTTDYDADFLKGIALNETYGTYGDFFWGNDTLSLSESFLKAKDYASGWEELDSQNNTIIPTNGSYNIFSFDVNSSIRKLKWDLNWNDTSVDFNLTIIQPNGSIIEIPSNKDDIPENIILISDQQPKSLVLDFPKNGTWKFNITAINISPSGELIKTRLSSYNPPIFIESVTQLEEPVLIENYNIFSKINKVEENMDTSNKSTFFELNITNKNPTFTFHNITPSVLGLDNENVTFSWSPSVVENLSVAQSKSFILNITILDPILFEGDLNFRIDCSEGYFDAYNQPVSLGYSEGIRYESTIITTYTVEIETELEYIPFTEEFNTLKWIGLFATLIILLSFLAVYIQSQQARLKDLAFKFRTRLFPDQSALEQALQREGISVTPADVSTIMADAGDLDKLGESVYKLTGRQLSPEELLRIASGTDIDRLAQRISVITGISVEEALRRLRDAQSIDDLIQQLDLDSERFLDIIARDEEVLNFQTKVKGLMIPRDRVISGIKSNENLDVDRFRSRLKKTFRRR